MDCERIISAVKKYTAQIERCVEGKVPLHTANAIWSTRENLEKAIERETKPLDIDSLQPLNIVALFGFELKIVSSYTLKGSKDYDLEIPGYLGAAQMIHEHNNEMSHCQGRCNNDHTRFKMLFLSCLAAENSEVNEDDWVDAGHAPRTFQLCGRTGLIDMVSYQGRMRKIDLVADYVLWYGKKAHLGTNLVVFHTKGGVLTGLYFRQALAYMSAIQKDRRKFISNACMYGIATNGEEYYFICFDEKGKVSVHMASTAWPSEFNSAYNHMRMFIAKAKQATTISIDEALLAQHPRSVCLYDPEEVGRSTETVESVIA